MKNIEHVRVLVLPDGQMDRANAARYLGRSTKTLAEWYRLGLGPESFLIGGRRFYRLSDLQQFTKAKTVYGEAH